eukprot:13987387-Ditylum_brightwellii.AAC.1
MCVRTKGATESKPNTGGYQCLPICKGCIEDGPGACKKKWKICTTEQDSGQQKEATMKQKLEQGTKRKSKQT